MPPPDAPARRLSSLHSMAERPSRPRAPSSTAPASWWRNLWKDAVHKKFLDVDGDWKFTKLTAIPPTIEPVRGAMDGFMCPITHDVMWDPRLVDCPEGHVFDRAAIQDHMKRSEACPMCRAPIAAIQPNMHLRRIILEAVVVKCPYCPEEMAAGAILGHMNDRCPEVK
jgi:hypothetical protein